MKSTLVALALFVATSSASAQTPRPSVQQQFDAASTALGDENWAEALRLYEALEDRIRNNPRSLAVVRVRKAEALARLRRYSEADEAIRLGLPQLPAGDPSLEEDRLRALRTSGTIAELSLDFDEAVRRYRAGLGTEGPSELRLPLYRGLIQNLIFSDGEAALLAADEALRIVDSLPDNRRLRGQFKTLRGRVLLNLGRHAQARADLSEAVRLLGGMTSRVDSADIVARADLALAALFLGDANTAREYLAMTGAGRFRTGALTPVSDNRLPSCRDGLRPEDVAVIEFSVNLDGSVLHASPVYATTPTAAREMARSVQSWYFDPSQLADLHSLFRTLSRVELRCTRVDEPQSYWKSISAIMSSEPPARAVTAEALRAELARLDAARPLDRTAVFSTLVRLAEHPGVDAREKAALLRRAIDLAAEVRPDPLTTARILIFAQRIRGGELDRGALDPVALFGHPLARDRTDVTAALHFLYARDHYAMSEDAEALARIAQMKAAAGNAVPDSFRAESIALEAAIHSAMGNAERARDILASLGPSAARCAFRPRVVRTPAGSADFPTDALRWGFEGWAQAEVAVQTDGRVYEARRVAAYPPFVFGEATEKLLGRSRHAPLISSDGGPCVAVIRQVTFRMPD